jgi:hypothetical protein
MQVNDKWYGWIPTNLGAIKFDFIDKNNISNFSKRFKIESSNSVINITGAQLYSISDTSLFKRIIPFSSKKEHYSKTDIKLEDKHKNIIGNIKFYYSGSICFRISFILKLNGEVEFKLDSIDNKDNINVTDVSYDIKQTIYTILKLTMHGDNHHHQKVDNILKITLNSFNPSEILDNMLVHLKTIERNIKLLKRKCYTRLKQNVVLDEVDGYISYISTFVILFPLNKNLGNKLKIALNIKRSLKSLISKREKKFIVENTFKTTALTFFALILASNIFLNAFYDKNLLQAVGIDNIDRVYLFIYSIIFWLAMYALTVFCSFKSWLFYRRYGVFRFSKALKNLVV